MLGWCGGRRRQYCSLNGEVINYGQYSQRWMRISCLRERREKSSENETREPVSHSSFDLTTASLKLIYPYFPYPQRRPPTLLIYWQMTCQECLELFHSVVVFIVNLTGLRNAQKVDKRLFLGVPLRVFLEEISNGKLG